MTTVRAAAVIEGGSRSSGGALAAGAAIASAVIECLPPRRGGPGSSGGRCEWCPFEPLASESALALGLRKRRVPTRFPLVIIVVGQGVGVISCSN